MLHMSEYLKFRSKTINITLARLDRGEDICEATLQLLRMKFWITLVYIITANRITVTGEDFVT